MWPLLVCSILAVALIVERSRFWYRIYKRQNRVVREVLKCYRLDDLPGAIAQGLNIGDVEGTKTATVSAGISEALVSTASGMVVAIFTLVAVNTFRAFYQRQLALIQEYGGQLEILYRDRHSKTIIKMRNQYGRVRSISLSAQSKPLRSQL